MIVKRAYSRNKEKMFVHLTAEGTDNVSYMKKVDFTIDKNHFSVSVDVNDEFFGNVCCKDEFVKSDSHNNFFSFLAYSDTKMLFDMSAREFDLTDSKRALTAKILRGELPNTDDCIWQAISSIKKADRDAYVTVVKTLIPKINEKDIPIGEKYPITTHMVVGLFKQYVQPILLKDDELNNVYDDMEISELSPEIYTYELKPAEGSKESAKCGAVSFRFDCDDGALYVSGDAGSYAYHWGYNENEHFMQLMGRVDKDYLLSKLSDRIVFDLEESKTETIDQLKRYDSDVDETTIAEINGLDCENDRIFFVSAKSILDEKSYDDDIIQIVKRYPTNACIVVDRFMKYLQPMIKTRFKKADE